MRPIKLEKEKTVARAKVLVVSSKNKSIILRLPQVASPISSEAKRILLIFLRVFSQSKPSTSLIKKWKRPIV
jgi:hypothetical protein